MVLKNEISQKNKYFSRLDRWDLNVAVRQIRRKTNRR